MNLLKPLLKSKTFEKYSSRLNLGFTLKKSLNHKPKIGIAVLIWERAEYLEPCLESLFKTELYDYDVTFLLNDDGSEDPKVKEIINKPRDSKYKIVRNFTPKGHGSWGAAFNKAVKKLLEIDNFDIVGTCDSDVLFNQEWLKASVETFLWAKKNHKDHKLIKFSSFNSSDFLFHNILGVYDSPVGKYVIKERMGDVTNMFFTEDLQKVGFYAEDKDDETLKTEFFKKHQLRYFSTETSYTEHIGQVSLLNQWRPTPVLNAVHAMKPVDDSRWNDLVQSYRKHPEEYYLEYDREYNNFVYKLKFWAGLGAIAKFNNFVGKYKDKLIRKIEIYNRYRKNRNWWNRNLNSVAKQYNVDVKKNIPEIKPSNLPLDIIITTIDRDLPVLELSLNSIKENLKHPINKIKIVAPITDTVKEFCERMNCELVDENTILPIKVKDIDYVVDGDNRAGWLFQQLLKLGAEKIAETENYMVFDADTLLMRPHVFERDGKFVFDLADEYYTTYFKTYERLTGLYPKLPFSFVVHHMMFNKKYLADFKSLIEKKHDTDWVTAIINCTDKTDPSGFSEFESFGNYMFEVAKDKLQFEYWYNLSVGRNFLYKVHDLKRKHSDKYKTLSFQYYKIVKEEDL